LLVQARAAKTEAMFAGDIGPADAMQRDEELGLRHLGGPMLLRRFLLSR